MNLPQFKPFK